MQELVLEVVCSVVIVGGVAHLPLMVEAPMTLLPKLHLLIAFRLAN